MHSGDFSAKIVAMRQKLNRLATTVLQHQQIRWITMMMAMMMMMMAMGGDHNLLLFLSHVLCLGGQLGSHGVESLGSCAGAACAVYGLFMNPNFAMCLLTTFSNCAPLICH